MSPLKGISCRTGGRRENVTHNASPRRRMNHCPSTPIGQMNLAESAMFIYPCSITQP